MREIPLVNGMLALVDDADYGELASHEWHAYNYARGPTPLWYATRRIYIAETKLSTGIFMHRQILQPEERQRIDHRNGNGLDNQRSNLRIATGAQNLHNQRKTSLPRSSRYKGVSWSNWRGKWIAYINVNGQRYSLGGFTNEIAAARAYDDAAREHFGEFAHLNLP